jgi:hypothetical protein
VQSSQLQQLLLQLCDASLNLRRGHMPIDI